MFFPTSTESMPSYMASCQLSAVEVMNTTTRLCPMLSKLYSVFAHVPPYASHCSAVTISGMTHSVTVTGTAALAYGSPNSAAAASFWHVVSVRSP